MDEIDYRVEKEQTAENKEWKTNKWAQKAY